MVICPQCGQENSDGSRFCESCGQGLSEAPVTAEVRLKPLAVGAKLKSGFEIAEILESTADENRYRASRRSSDKPELFQVRERPGAAARDGVADASAQSPETDSRPVPEGENPNGPRAKTAELRPPVSAEPETPEAVEPPRASPEPSETVAPAEAAAEEPSAIVDCAAAPSLGDGEADSSEAVTQSAGSDEAPVTLEAADAVQDDLGEVFGRVLGLSLTLKHPAFYSAIEGFASDGRVYLAYPDERLTPLAKRSGGIMMREAEAINVAIQVCQAVGFLSRRGLRLNDICPDSIVYGADGRVKVTGLDYVSNDIELQSDPIFNDGYTAPEIYRGKKVDKRADIFSIGCLLYTCLTGERIACESWREEAGPVRFYPPHVMSHDVEEIVRRAIAFNPTERWASVDQMKAELLKAMADPRVRAGGLTDVGMVRDHNEDAILMVEYRRDALIEPNRNFLYLVSDGMGGAEAGEVAAGITVAAVREFVERGLDNGEGTNSEALLQAALEEANRQVLDYQARHPESRGMGATGAGVLILPTHAGVAWVGDSRVYLWEINRLKQVTKDHSLVQRLVEIGQITPEEARHHEHKNVITRSIGARQSGPAGAEGLTLKLKRGDRLVLCSDGLTAHVEDPEIERIIGCHTDPHEAARELVAAANAGGGTDNISVIAVFVD